MAGLRNPQSVDLPPIEFESEPATIPVAEVKEITKQELAEYLLGEKSQDDSVFDWLSNH